MRATLFDLPPVVERALLLANAEGTDLERLGPLMEPGVAQLDRKVVEERRLWMAEPYEMVVPQQSIKLVTDWISGVPK